jgi:hypothetical protein
MRSKDKIYDFVVVLKNKNLGTIEKTSMLLVILMNIIFITVLYWNPNDGNAWFFLICTLLILAGAYFDKKKHKHIRYATLLIVGGIGLVSFNMIPFFIGLLYILAGIMEKHFIAKKEFGFSTDGIVENGVLGRKINWEELSNVIIKDQLLTIDFKDKKLIQMETDDEENDEYEVDDNEFNTYCRNRLAHQE